MNPTFKGGTLRATDQELEGARIASAGHSIKGASTGTLPATDQELEEARTASALTPVDGMAVKPTNDTVPAGPAIVRPTVRDLALDEVFEQIASSPPARRSWLIRQHAGGDVEVERALSRMLGANAAVGVPGPALAPGACLFGRYLLVRELGEGASAPVWHAQDRALSRDVALKVFVTGGAGNDRALRAVVQEARASSRLVSDHVVRVYSAPEDPQLGLAAIEMELCREVDAEGRYADGQDLSKYVTRGGVKSEADARAAARWVYEAALGVSEAHRHEVFHRDLKPSNMLVGPLSRRLQVSDFGVAIWHVARGGAEPSAHPAARQTLTQNAYGEGGIQLVGTPAYMAPEQAFGLRIDLRTPEGRKVLAGVDVYGLGATLFEFLTGAAPHERPADDSLEAMLASARKNAVPFALLGRRCIPEGLATLVKRALASKPEDRYPTADALASDLCAFLNHKPMSHERSNPMRRLRLAGRRNPPLVKSILGAALFLSAAGYSSMELVRSQNKLGVVQEQLAEAQRELDQRNEALKTGAATTKGLARQLDQSRADVARATIELQRATTKADKEQAENALNLARIRKLETQRAILEQEANSLRQNVDSLRGEVATLKENNRDLSGQVANLSAKNVALREKVAELEAKKAELEAKKAELEAALKAKDDELVAKNAKLDELKSQNEKLEAAGAERDKAIRENQDTIQKKEIDIQRRDKTIRDQASEIARLTQAAKSPESKAPEGAPKGGRDSSGGVARAPEARSEDAPKPPKPVTPEAPAPPTGTESAEDK